MYDYIVIGSGFGGSVSALRLSEKGYRVAVIEQGKRFKADELKAAGESAKKLFWLPALGLKGPFSQVILKHISVVRGIGVGGGSLVYAAVLLRPKKAFYQSKDWQHLANWQQELAPHYDTASRMLGVMTNPRRSKMDEQLQQTAAVLGCEKSFGNVPQGIFFSDNAEPVSDPFFDGKGPTRSSCTFCGRCATGCAEGAKNSLDKNYLYLAENNGVDIFAEMKAQIIEPCSGGYQITVKSTSGEFNSRLFKTKKLVLAGGVLGTMDLLFNCRDHYRTLPNISARLGEKVRTNSEALVASIARDQQEDLTDGATISTDFYYGEDTHITQNRLPPSHNIMRFYFGPMVDDKNPIRRALKTLLLYLRQPRKSTISWRKSWYRRTTLLTVMQNLDNALDLRFGRRWFMPWKKILLTKARQGQSAPTYIAKANQAARAFAKVSNGDAQSIVMESIANKSLTAHILGGACIGDSRENSVVDIQHRLHAYPDIYVADASVIPANIGVNPSLTITAMAERMASLIPDREAAGRDGDSCRSEKSAEAR